MKPLNEIKTVEFELNNYEYMHLYDTNETQVWDTSGDPLINLPGHMTPHEVVNILTAYYAGREVGKAVGANNARWEMRRALGID